MRFDGVTYQPELDYDRLSKQHVRVKTAMSEYERAVKAREAPSLAKMSAAVLAANASPNPLHEKKAVLTPALRTKLAEARAHVGYNIAAINAKHPTV